MHTLIIQNCRRDPVAAGIVRSPPFDAFFIFAQNIFCRIDNAFTPERPADAVDIVEFNAGAEIQIFIREFFTFLFQTIEFFRRQILKRFGKNDKIQYCKALAASGSDARMNGCEMPVVINSGSGNQGITASVPVIAYHSKLNLDKEILYRALVVSNLCTIHIKNNIGKLSAYCGVVIAGAGCGAGICYLEGGRLNEVAHTLVNALAIISGVVCDGAKSSCAAKIASSVEAGIFGYYMFKEGNEFISGEGIVKKGVENTIKAVGDLARVGMCETDKEIIYIMTH